MYQDQNVPAFFSCKVNSAQLVFMRSLKDIHSSACSCGGMASHLFSIFASVGLEIACACRLWTIAVGVDRTTAAPRELRIKEVRNMVGVWCLWYKREESSIEMISWETVLLRLGCMSNWAFEMVREVLLADVEIVRGLANELYFASRDYDTPASRDLQEPVGYGRQQIRKVKKIIHLDIASQYTQCPQFCAFKRRITPSSMQYGPGQNIGKGRLGMVVTTEALQSRATFDFLACYYPVHWLEATKSICFNWWITFIHQK
jgi:hypothetical protein